MRFVYLRAGPAVGYFLGSWKAMEWAHLWPSPHAIGAALAILSSLLATTAVAILIWGEK